MKNRQHDEIRNDPRRRAIVKVMATLAIAALAIHPFAGSAEAQSLLDKIKNGETIRIAFSNEPPHAYPGPNNEPLGFVNAIGIDILKKLGATKIEPVVTEWGSLIPGLQADRFDIITGGMAITPERCRNALFTEPVVAIIDGMLVPKGNPKGLHSYEDVRDKGLTVVTGTGWAAVSLAHKVGIPDDKLLQVAGGAAEAVQAVKAGRADAAVGEFFTWKAFANRDDSLEMAEPFTQAPGGAGGEGIAFLPNQQATVDAFNKVLKHYRGSDEMMRSVEKYGYTKAQLPPKSLTTAELCKG
ncbi:ectoine/hydroxyectoine ABC transporter substrate-binding protein EhuB [Mesorhizobium sp. M0040]|uniref:ectoine/hydroxyectoine ABC transporter substrate-binding protein EhuB n=1 Tax=Mesorhizobium sp. M0040 TaxID=2956855 RepID=UPI00333CE9D8